MNVVPPANNDNNVKPTPTVQHNDPSPTSILTGVFEPQPIQQVQKKVWKSNGAAMVGLIPKSTFLKWIRDDLADSVKSSVLKMKKNLRDHRASVLYHFSKAGKTKAKGDAGVDDSDRPLTHLSVDSDED